MKKGDRFWCCWLSRFVWFRREFVNRSGEVMYVFEDITDSQFVLSVRDLHRLEGRA